MFPMSDSPDSGYCGLSNMIGDFNMTEHRFEPEEHKVVKKEIVVHECYYCGLDITDRHLLKVGADQFWHLHCLRCSQCQIGLDDFGTCFFRDRNAYCKGCYTSKFSSCCSACKLPIAAGDWVRRVRDYVYHLDCFVCERCKTNLSTGETFSMIGHRLRCDAHLIQREEPIVVKQEPIVEAPRAKDEEASSSTSSDDNPRSAEGSPKRKRQRTTFTEHQLSILRTSFNLDRNPTTTRLEVIADMAGLTKKVVQIWYQNSRQRLKKKQGEVNTNTANTLSSHFGMTLNGSNTVTAQQYYQQIPQFFNFS